MASGNGLGGLKTAGLGATLVSAAAASICCIAPITGAFLGLSGLGALAKYERYRPHFAAVTLILLVAGFYSAYRKKPASACGPGSICAVEGADRMEKLNRRVLWVVTVIALLVLSFPAWSGWIWS